MHFPPGVQRRVQGGYSELRCRVAARVVTLRQYGELGVRVLHEELELIQSVSGIQRGGYRACPGHRKERDEKFKTVGKYDRDRLTGRDDGRKVLSDPLYLIP